MSNYLKELFFGWGWFLWFGFFFLWVSTIGNWGYTYQAHQKFSKLFPQTKAFDILDERFARGDISRHEYTELKSTIIGINQAAANKTA